MAYVGPMTTEGKNRIMIYGPKDDGTYVVEFRTDAGQTLAISIPITEAAVIQHFQERMPYGLLVAPLRRKRESPLPKK
jgi:hypothetical protein